MGVQVDLNYRRNAWKPFFATGSDADTALATALAALTPLTTSPKGEGVFTAMGAQTLVLTPYGQGADNATFKFAVILWRRTADGLYLPHVPVATATATLGVMTGVSGKAISDTHRFADTLTVPSGVTAHSPANGTPAQLWLDTEGVDAAQIIVEVETATTGNVIGVVK